MKKIPIIIVLYQWVDESIELEDLTVTAELHRELYCGGALGTRASSSKTFGCVVTKVYGGGVKSLSGESLIIDS